MLSMTGQGRAAHREDGLDIEVEIRSVNHRFFNFKLSLPPAFGRYEAEVERAARSRIARGSVTVTVNLKSTAPGRAALPDPSVFRAFYRGLKDVQKKLGIPGEIRMENLLALPQLWSADGTESQTADLWPKVRTLLDRALDDHAKMRAREGKGIRKDLLGRLDLIEERLAEIRTRAPEVVAAYQKKLLDRVNALVSQHGLEIAKTDLVREVAVFADRSDISEEVQRLQSHCGEFRKILGRPGSLGRKIDFLTQEMVRETNTLAAKCGDSGISAQAVEIKAELEKIKEQSENVE